MRRSGLWVGLMAGTPVAAALVYGCGETSFGTCADNGTCAGDAGVDAGDGATGVYLDAAGGKHDADAPADAPADVAAEAEAAADGGADADASDGFDGWDGFTCDGTKDPSVEACAVDSAYGVFVSGSTGADRGAGTKEAPLKTLAAGIAKAVAGGLKRVYVCAGTYDEHVSVGASADGVAVFGGLDCTAWAYATTNTVKVAPSSAGYALEATGLTAGATFEDVSFASVDAPVAAPASGPGASSVAVFANSAKLTLVRVAVSAGNGQPGAGGATGSNWTGTAQGGSGPATAFAGGLGGSNTCSDGMTSSSGGTGGALGGALPQSGSSVPSVGSLNGGASGNGTCTPGTAGASGLANAPAAAGKGAMSSGALASAGWAASGPGSDGSNANPGQGAGGGGANAIGASPGSGGGGGAGGCGGAKGSGGATGGSSIGIASFQSTLALRTVVVTANNGGGGGSGGPGQPGQPGGGPGAGGGAACSGGTGGIGGGGGGGGGGAGGLSAGIVWSGTGPSIDGTAISTSPVATLAGITPGTAGAKGLHGSGGTAGSGTAGPDGTDGVAGTAVAVMQSP